jgi:hypothetical protein
MVGRKQIRPRYIKEVGDITEEHLQYTINTMYNMRLKDPVQWGKISAGKLANYLKVFNAKVKNEILSTLIERNAVEVSKESYQTKRRVESTTYYSLTQELLDEAG